MSDYLKKFTIDRNVWLRGEGMKASRLLRESDSKMCCVGIYLRACGAPDKYLIGNSTITDCVANAGGEKPEFVPEVMIINGHPAYGQPANLVELYIANDVIGVPEDEREQAIATGFSNFGIKVEFVNGA